MTAGKVASANIDWASLGFNFIQTNGHVKYTWRDGKWGQGEFITEPWINMHIASSGLNYGQECFEGLKAWQCKDGKVRLFRPYNNADRLRYSASRACMVAPPRELFIEAVTRIVKENIEYVPPYGSGGSLYIRPLLVGNGPMLNLVPSEEYSFIVYAVPVGNFYKDGIKTTNAVIIDDFDRAAPLGTGSVKLGGNYAPCLPSTQAAHEAGYTMALFLDAATRTYIEEFSSCNFIAVINGETIDDTVIVTPESPSILPSITTQTILELAESFGWKVIRRPISLEEVKSGKFDEVAGCGTAVIVTPVHTINHKGEDIKITSNKTLGPALEKIYKTVRALQMLEIEDKFEWCYPAEGF